MKFKFWGVRGSIPTPGPGTVKYGGNTTCIEVKNAGNDLLILDAGTGIFALAQTLAAQSPIVAHILITHTHWDHIQGLPFFLPLLSARNQIHLYGGMDPVTQQGIERALSAQLQYSYFPIIQSQLKAQLHYHTLKPGEPIQIGSTTIVPTVLNHPVLNFGYRLNDSDGSSLFFTGDYEAPHNPYAPDDPDYASNQQFIEAKLLEVHAAMRNVDALIVDSSYTDAEYLKKVGWGHGTYGAALQLARQTGAKKLFLTHHEPTRDDRELEAIFREEVTKAGPTEFEIVLAREGIEHVL
ncbi:MBL fold metallo-hydrolase [Methylomonas sp. SURF-2]|uniref:MBL fold metallo-hydrolase n=1 Tax=Methylomonas subterranea TaxID=2952225 RepID=A0ABT1TGB0_9GAMM|nr:MBL fold metallo-hydrolase [Methylomonas sp. SURF-2]MCQ8104502.1 MBL fold metallo-hydrolase [Methylomonas sp. SURF-2]